MRLIMPSQVLRRRVECLGCGYHRSDLRRIRLPDDIARYRAVLVPLHCKVFFISHSAVSLREDILYMAIQQHSRSHGAGETTLYSQ